MPRSFPKNVVREKIAAFFSVFVVMHPLWSHEVTVFVFFLAPDIFIRMFKGLVKSVTGGGKGKNLVRAVVYAKSSLLTILRKFSGYFRFPLLFLIPSFTLLSMFVYVYCHSG